MIESLEEVLLRLAPRPDLLHDCLGIGKFAEVTMTSDGFFLGRAWGDCGFNYFLGRPSTSARARSRLLFEQLSPEHKTELIGKLRARWIPPETIGIPELKS
jgi:hypothetical protein